MPRTTLAAATVLLCIASASRLPGQASQPSSRDAVPDVETVGTAVRRIAPDRATVHLTVQSKAATAGAAATLNTRAVQAVLDTLRRAALDSALATASYHVGPNYERPISREEPTRSGYLATTVLRVRLSRLDQVGRVIDAALARGATGVESMWFESSTAEEARREALADAAAAARRDAEALARSLGGSLGPLLSVTTAPSNDPRRINVSMGEVGMVRGTQITPTEIVISAGVVTRWQFIPR
jgi:uncharacterized protein YggE